MNKTEQIKTKFESCPNDPDLTVAYQYGHQQGRDVAKAEFHAELMQLLEQMSVCSFVADMRELVRVLAAKHAPAQPEK